MVAAANSLTRLLESGVIFAFLLGMNPNTDVLGRCLEPLHTTHTDSGVDGSKEKLRRYQIS